MKRWVYAYRYVPGEATRLERMLLEHSGDLLRTATESPLAEPAVDGSFLVKLHSRLAGLDVAKGVRVRTGVAYRSDRRVVLPLDWHAEPAKHAFPAFTGTFELEPLDAYTSQLSLVGSYTVPLGPVGAAVDATLLRSVGQATADAIVQAIATALRDGLPDGSAQSTGIRHGEGLRVSDVMTGDPLLIDAEMSLRTAALLLFQWGISGAPVVAADGQLIGVITEADLLAKEATRDFGLSRKALEEDRRRLAVTVGEACSRPTAVTVPEARLTEVARTLLDEDIKRLVVIDDGRVAGIVSRHDVLAALIRDDADIEMAVHRVVEAAAGPEVSARVEWGVVTLSGHTELRSSALRLGEVVEEVDGVMAVDATAVQWEVDDIVPTYAHP